MEDKKKITLQGKIILAALCIAVAIMIAAGKDDSAKTKVPETAAVTAQSAPSEESTSRDLEMQEGNIETVCTQAAKDHFRYDIELKDPDVTTKGKWMTIVWHARVENGMGGHVNMMVKCRTDMHDFQITTSQ